MNSKIIILIALTIVTLGGYFAYANYTNEKREILKQESENLKWKQEQRDKQVAEKLELLKKAEEVRIKKELKSKQLQVKILKQEAENLKWKQEQRDKKDAEVKKLKLFKKEHKISLFSIIDNHSIEFNQYLINKVKNIKNENIKIEEISSSNNVIIYLQSNLKSNMSKDKITKIIITINKKINYGKITIISGNDGTLYYYITNNKVSVKTDEQIKLDSILDSITTEPTEAEKKDIQGKQDSISQIKYKIHQKDSKNNLVIYVSTSITSKVLQDQINYLVPKIIKGSKNKRIYITKGYDGNLEIIINNYNESINKDTNEEIKKPYKVFGSKKSNTIYYFNFNESEIMNKDTLKSFLNDLKKAINDFGIKKLIIFGHTDNIGSNLYNQSLSYKRANSLNSEFRKLGIEIEYRPKGEQNPIATNDTPEGRALNRRIEIFYIWGE